MKYRCRCGFHEHPSTIISQSICIYENGGSIVVNRMILTDVVEWNDCAVGVELAGDLAVAGDGDDGAPGAVAGHQLSTAP